MGSTSAFGIQSGFYTVWPNKFVDAIVQPVEQWKSYLRPSNVQREVGRCANLVSVSCHTFLKAKPAVGKFF